MKSKTLKLRFCSDCERSFYSTGDDLICTDCQITRNDKTLELKSRHCMECGMTLPASTVGNYCYEHDMRAGTLPGDNNAFVTEADYNKFEAYRSIKDAKGEKKCLISK